MKSNKSKMRCNKEFTLIELADILSAVAVPQYQLAVRKSQYATLIHNMKALAENQKTTTLLGDCIKVNHSIKPAPFFSGAG